MKTPILPEVVVTGKRKKKSTVTPPPIKDAINQAFTQQFMNESGLFDDYDDDDMMKYLYSNLLLGNKMKMPAFKGGKDEYDTEVYLPNIDVYPDPELRRNVVYTWPDLNTRRNVLNTINDYKTTVENGQPYYTASGKNVAYRSGALLPANLEVERAVNLVREAGYPETNFESKYNNDGSNFRNYIAVHKEKQSGFFKNFFNWLGGIFGKRPVNQSTIHAGSSPFESRTGYFAELPHAYQYAKGLDKYGELVNINTPFFVKDFRSVEEKSADALRYNDPTNIEYLAHKIIEPYMYMYMRGGENASIDDFNSGVEDRLLYNLKTHRGAL